MKNNDWRKHLHSGDEVTWNDPDNGTCSRTDVIQDIVYGEDDTAWIQWKDGSEVQVFLSEPT
jgi:hypothetical protein